MVFTSLDKVKRELIAVASESPAARSTQLTAMIRFTSGLRHIPSRGIMFCPQFDTVEAAKWVKKAFEDLYGFKSIIREINKKTETEFLRKYVVLMDTEVLSLALRMSLVDPRGNVPTAVEFAPENPVLTAAAWRGAFIAHGSLSEPGEEVYLKVACPTEETSLALQRAASRLGVESDIERIDGVLHLIIRDEMEIKKLLTSLGAGNECAQWASGDNSLPYNTKSPRLVNFDDANMKRSMDASAKACAKVKWGFAVLGDEIPRNLRAIGELRLEHVRASLDELGRYAEPQLTKDAVAGRLRRLLKLIDKAMVEHNIDPDTFLQDNSTEQGSEDDN